MSGLNRNWLSITHHFSNNKFLNLLFKLSGHDIKPNGTGLWIRNTKWLKNDWNRTYTPNKWLETKSNCFWLSNNMSNGRQTKKSEKRFPFVYTYTKLLTDTLNLKFLKGFTNKKNNWICTETPGVQYNAL